MICGVMCNFLKIKFTEVIVQFGRFGIWTSSQILSARLYPLDYVPSVYSRLIMGSHIYVQVTLQVHILDMQNEHSNKVKMRFSELNLQEITAIACHMNPKKSIFAIRIHHSYIFVFFLGYILSDIKNNYFFCNFLIWICSSY